MDEVLEELLDAAREGGSGEILRMQTTFVDVAWTAAESSSRSCYRIHYQHKLGFSLEHRAFSVIALARDHPVCVDFVEPRATIYVATKVEDPGVILRELEELASRFFDGWRSLNRYLNDQIDAHRLLREGYGELLSGPRRFVDEAARLLEEHGVSVTVLKGAEHTWDAWALTMDRCFVVAEGFRAVRVQP